MKVKSKSFGNLYIENDILWEVRSQQNNIRMIPKEIGKSDKYKVIGTHIFPNQQKTSNWLDDSELLVERLPNDLDFTFITNFLSSIELSFAMIKPGFEFLESFLPALNILTFDFSQPTENFKLVR
jgi:hypothetical protein